LEEAPTLSVLIPTLLARSELLARLQAQLDGQITSLDEPSAVEVLVLPDEGELSIGRKRNDLIASASGEFVVFIDDDDRVADDYIVRILHAIKSNPSIDCVGHKGTLVFRNGQTRMFVHSICHRHWGYEDGVYVRPPAHISPIRRTIANRYLFEDVSYSEDMDWVSRLVSDGVLRNEAFIDAPIYIYETRRLLAYQWLLDRTQWLRRLFGLEFAQRLALKRKLE
jgi:glycosyltransferase involved in cell wall biosynthesis